MNPRSCQTVHRTVGSPHGDRRCPHLNISFHQTKKLVGYYSFSINFCICFLYKCNLQKKTLRGWILVRAPVKQSTGLFDSPHGDRRCPHLNLSFHQTKKLVGLRQAFCLVGEGGFGPPKSVTTDLQSAPFGRSGTLPYYLVKYSRCRSTENKWSW